MYNIIYGNNVNRKSDIVDGSMTLAEFIRSHDVDVSKGTTTINGTVADVDQLNTPISELGFGNKLYLLQVIKANNA